MLKIIKINVRKELRSRKLEVIERMKESLGEFEMKVLKNEIKALEKKARESMTNIEEGTRKLHEEGKITILETRMSRIRRIRDESNTRNKKIKIETVLLTSCIFVKISQTINTII